MKTKLQKQENLKTGEGMFSKSEALIFVDFKNVKTADLRMLRQELKKTESPLFVIKKRLLGVLLKKHGIEFDGSQFKTSVGTVFASNLEKAASSVHAFFKKLQVEKRGDVKKILGGYDVKKKDFVPAERMIFIGGLPPREVLLAQLASMIAAPVRSLLYVLDQLRRSASAEVGVPTEASGKSGQ